MSAERHYLDDDAPPEHVQQGVQILIVFAQVMELKAKVETLERSIEALEDANTRLLKRVRGNEAAAPI